jgi:2-polyprenyl-3-methyl-5-hydroxy-6-metoxy-1,4-benzoquinol methylase
MPPDPRVRDYFERCADRFDGFYREASGGLLARAAHVVFREPGLRRRFEAAARIIGDPSGKRILDLGCGSGVYSIYYAARGADVLGVDFSSRMIALAGQNAQSEGAAPRLVHGDFMSIDVDGRFDATLMMGVFDYVPPADRAGLLRRARDLTAGPVIASFPKLFTVLQTPIRKAWLARQGAPVYFYTSGSVCALAEDAGLTARFHDCGPIWTVEFVNRTPKPPTAEDRL